MSHTVYVYTKSCRSIYMYSSSNFCYCITGNAHIIYIFIYKYMHTNKEKGSQLKF